MRLQAVTDRYAGPGDCSAAGWSLVKLGRRYEVSSGTPPVA